ncbi:MAG: hypothetical protein V1707_00670 [bacterium]
MKSLLLYVITFVVLSSNVFAQNSLFVESEYKYSDDPSVITYRLGAKHDFNSKISFSSFGLVNKNYAQAHFSINYKITDWLKAGVGQGIEQSKELWRLAANLQIMNGSYSWVTFYEHGMNGYWFQTELKYQFNPSLSVGIFGRRFVGFGPEIAIAIPQTPFVVWTVPYAYDIESKKSGGLIVILLLF